MRALIAGALALLAPAVAGAADTQPSRVQAAAAVNEYKTVRERCGGDAACEGQAQRRFVEVVSCVVRGKPQVDAATLQQDFMRYVDVVSEVLDKQGGPAGAAPGPCFSAAAAASPAGGGAATGAGAPAGAPPAARTAPAAADDGPSVDTLRRFRKQAEEQSKPVRPLPDTPEDDHAKLKADVESMRQRLKAATPPAGGGGATGAVAVPGAVAPVPAPAAAPVPTAVAPTPATAAPTTAPSGLAPNRVIQGTPTTPGRFPVQAAPPPTPAPAPAPIPLTTRRPPLPPPGTKYYFVPAENKYAPCSNPPKENYSPAVKNYVEQCK